MRHWGDAIEGTIAFARFLFPAGVGIAAAATAWNDIANPALRVVVALAAAGIGIGVGIFWQATGGTGSDDAYWNRRH